MARKKVRLDELVLLRGFADSRNKAKALILAGKIRSGTEVLDKAGREVPPDLQLSIQEDSPYVSRGADKLDGFFKAFPWTIPGRPILDVGASTGGFSDYLLQAGASEAVCVDVGHGQLHYKLRCDARVHNLERMNARYLKAENLPYPTYPLIVMDLSFISLRLILPAVWPLLESKGLLVALIKPQFEAGKAEADRFRGVISDDAVRERIRSEVLAFARDELSQSRLLGSCESPISGMNGNREFLAGWTREEGDSPSADAQ
jgi:23S rRNA (cytidine1920-2'-O)/16S rRNA (cytidine1409-2'-O)-methyltransferase